MKKVLLITMIFCIGCSNNAYNEYDKNLQIMINEPDNINKSIKLYNIYENDINLMYFNEFSNPRGGINSWDEFSSISNIKIININNNDIKKPWINQYYKYFSIIDKRTQILAGIAPDVATMAKWEIDFFAKNKLILPLTNYISLFNNYIQQYYVDNILFSIMEPTYPYNMLWYNKNIINELGLIDPIYQYKNNQWNWESFLNLLINVKNNYANYFPMLGTLNHECAFMASNGVEFISINENGKFAFSLDNKYINTLIFLNDLIDKHNVLNGLYIDGTLAIDTTWMTDSIYYLTNRVFIDNLSSRKLFIENKVFMLYDLVNHTNKQTFYQQLNEANISLSYIYVPTGPDAINTREKNGWVNSNSYDKCYVITSSCEHPDAAATYIAWVLSDSNNFMLRKKI